MCIKTANIEIFVTDAKRKFLIILKCILFSQHFILEFID